MHRVVLSFVLVVFLGVSLSPQSSEGTPVHRKSDIQRHKWPKDKNLVNSVEKAQEILQRYGYLRCRLPRRRRQSVYSRHLPHSLPLCSHGDVKESIRLYQRRHKLQVTGKLDHETLALMSQSRCGNPDIDDPPGTPLASPFSSSSSSHASLASIALNRVRRNIPEYRKPSASNDETLPVLESEISSRQISSRRYTWIKRRMRHILKTENDLTARTQEYQYTNTPLPRYRRSINDIDDGESFLQDVITWRLLKSGYSNQLTVATQRAALALAFRMWSEVIPPMFVEDVQSHVDNIDILISFGKGDHMNCPNSFDGFGGQLSHALKFHGASEIHVDDDEHFTVASDQGTNLLKVAVHEVGHVLGLNHSSRNQSIMYAIYSQSIPNKNFELGWNDRKMIQELYGICRGRFDIVFDWVRRKPDGKFIFNTFLFRGDRYWMYENRYNRTRYGDPILIQSEWNGLPAYLDTVAHVWTHNMDNVFFFKGNHYWLYNSSADHIASGYPRNISDDFQARPNSEFSSIPNNLDAVFYDKRDGNLYFFKNEKVYAYDMSKGKYGCCLKGYPKPIREEFPAFTGSQALTGSVDSVYYSYTERTMYLFQGTQYWHNVGFSMSDRKPKNLLVGPFNINEKWIDVCDVESPNR